MPIRFVLFLVYFWTALHTIFGLAQLDSSFNAFDPDTNETASALNNLPLTSIITMQEVFFVPFAIPVPSASFFSDLKTLLLWDYPFFNGNWVFIRLFILSPVSFVTLILMITTVGPVIIAAAQLIVSAFIGPIARTLTGGVRGFIGG